MKIIKTNKLYTEFSIRYKDKPYVLILDTDVVNRMGRDIYNVYITVTRDKLLVMLGLERLHRYILKITGNEDIFRVEFINKNTLDCRIENMEVIGKQKSIKSIIVLTEQQRATAEILHEMKGDGTSWTRRYYNLNDRVILEFTKGDFIIDSIMDYDTYLKYKDYRLFPDKNITGDNAFYIKYYDVDSKRNTRFHRTLVEVTNTKAHVDHINRNTLDNRISNLRVVSPTINVINRGVFRNNTTGINGLTKTDKSYIATVGYNYRKVKRTFSISKYGEKEAKRLACKALEELKVQRLSKANTEHSVENKVD